MHVFFPSTDPSALLMYRSGYWDRLRISNNELVWHSKAEPCLEVLTSGTLLLTSEMPFTSSAILQIRQIQD